ncbi:EamA family transporter [Sphaerisporangium sp. TRM90804]|uniref:EamA family transporter n=1 Tax=Sphaerisporangium sp. TRM90804 TaxID=3031113 RepID=UPI0024491C38|nr:EamA family transporter [Sphaerisporangium sp. TRM90804]MDH2427120.1 EamA family transporter [Sphaerisporangium sp. TRM90804]
MIATPRSPWPYFVGSALFHYLGPAFAVLLFAQVAPLGVAGLRVWSAAAVFAVWRRPWRAWAGLDARGRWTVAGLGAVLASMNCCFYLAIERLPLATVAAIEFVPVIALAALGARTPRNAVALAGAVAGVYLLTGFQPGGDGPALVLAFANAALFGAYIVLAHRVSRLMEGVDGLALAMLAAAVLVTPATLVPAAPAFGDVVLLGAAIGVGISSSVIPYVCDQLAMARMRRSSYALFVALLPATAAVVGVLVLRQLPTVPDMAGVGLVIFAVALHRERRSQERV